LAREKMALNPQTEKATSPTLDMSNQSSLDRDPEKDAAVSAQHHHTVVHKRKWYPHSDKQVGGRIAPVLAHLKGYDFGSDSDISAAEILATQIEAESGNQLQYRTCSWQKVCCTSYFLSALTMY
jgi:hypothetical protein